jgi:hypothetical protein
MPRTPLSIAPGLVADDTSFAAEGAWLDGDKVRFWRGKPQVIGGWESFIQTQLTGVCRAALGWTDIAGVFNAAFGTHSNLQIAYGGALYDITPTLALPSATLSGATPLSVTIGSPTVTVTQAGHPLATGNSVIVSGAAAVGGIAPNGTFTVTVLTANTYTYTFGSNATSTATGGGGAVVVTPQVAFAAGLIDGIGGQGFGTGTYSTGSYSQPSPGAVYPRTWALSTWGQNLIANARGGPIYQWTNSPVTPAAPIANSPAQVTFALVTPQRQILAFGCNDEITGIFNPLAIRGCDIENPTVWATLATNNAFEHVLDGGGRIVAARNVGACLFIWTDSALYQGTFLGLPGQTYRFDRMGEHCGLLGPNAAAIGGQTALWLSSDLQFHKCAVGGEPSIVPSPMQTTLAANLTAAQQDKVIASTVSKFGEVWFFYPDARDGSENSRYVSAGAVSNSTVAANYSSLIADAWARGTLARTAFIDAGPYQYPLGVDPTGNVYIHERGNSADGGAISWYLESAGQYLGEGDQFVQIKGVWPDFQGQIGPIALTVYTRKYPQDTDRVRGPYSLAVSQSKKDFLASGRVVRVRIAGNSGPTFMRLGKLEFETDQTGTQ